MVQVKSPLMSMTAQKQLGKELIYKMKGNRAFVTGYSRPGRKNPFSPSADQVEKREFYASAIALWQDKTQEQKDYWNNLVKSQNLNMSGWNLFYRELFDDQAWGLENSYHGTRNYGYYQYGKQPTI